MHLKKKRYALPSQKTRRVRVHFFFPFVKFFSWPLEKNTTKTEQESWKKNGKKKHFFFRFATGTVFLPVPVLFFFFFYVIPIFYQEKKQKKREVKSNKTFCFSVC